jgi:hypothetical protein
MANGVTPLILNPESTSRYEGMHEFGLCRAADTPEENKPQRFLRITS